MPANSTVMGIGIGAWIIMLGIYVIAGLQILGALKYGDRTIADILGIGGDGVAEEGGT